MNTATMEPQLQDKLKNPKYRNWVKAGLVLQYTKHGIQDFVSSEVDNIYQQMVSDICRQNGLNQGILCNVCTTQNVLTCPTREVCSTSNRCYYHNKQDPTMSPRVCQICGGFRDRIIHSHRYRKPSWINTNALQWHRSSWEVAKCFMTASGYNAVTNADDTDLPGLLSVLINLTGFQNKIGVNLSSPTNVFRQARTIRNQILHTSSFELDDTVLTGYIDVMIQLLSDPKYLATDLNAKKAIDNLRQLKTGSITVTSEEATQVQKEYEIAIKEITAMGGEQVQRVRNTGEEIIQAIQRERIEQKELEGEDVRKVGNNIYYLTNKQLGHGSSAVVYEGRYINNEVKKAAVKRIELGNNSYFQEIQILEKIKHFNMVGYFGSHAEKDILYLAFELCDGTLHDYVKTPAWKTSFEPRKVIQNMANGLSFLHSNDIVHRDLKPDNIFVVLEGAAVCKVVLGDFGSAKCTPNTLGSLTGNRGTQGYLAPEAFNAILELEKDGEIRSCLSRRSDIFSLGLLFYFVYTPGNHPYGKNGLVCQINIGSGQPPELNGITQYDYLCQLLEEMLSKNPEERPTATDICAQMALWPQ